MKLWLIRFKVKLRTVKAAEAGRQIRQCSGLWTRLQRLLSQLRGFVDAAVKKRNAGTEFFGDMAGRLGCHGLPYG
jgi:hypothetical protein